MLQDWLMQPHYFIELYTTYEHLWQNIPLSGVRSNRLSYGSSTPNFLQNSTIPLQIVAFLVPKALTSLLHLQDRNSLLFSQKHGLHIER